MCIRDRAPDLCGEPCFFIDHDKLNPNNPNNDPNNSNKTGPVITGSIRLSINATEPVVLYPGHEIAVSLWAATRGPEGNRELVYTQHGSQIYGGKITEPVESKKPSQAPNKSNANNNQSNGAGFNNNNGMQNQSNNFNQNNNFNQGNGNNSNFNNNNNNGNFNNNNNVNDHIPNFNSSPV